jgi:proline dehydrogenase
LKHANSYYPHKSTRELRASRVLFRLLSYQKLVFLGLLLWRFLRFFRLPVSPLVRFTGYYQFCAGKNVAACAEITQRMATFGVQSVLDYANEHAKTEEDFDHNVKIVLETIKAAQENEVYTFAVVKPTAIGAFALFEKKSSGVSFSNEEKQAWENSKKRFEQLVQKAKEAEIVLMIDAEESWIQPGIDAMVLPLLQKYNRNGVVVAITLQLYLKGRAGVYDQLLLDAAKNSYFLGIKFVRGAYMEKERIRAQQLGIPSPVCDTKVETDAQYRQVLVRAIEELNTHICIVATHNEDDISWVVNSCKKMNISLSNPNLWFSQLYGMRDYISFDVAAQGANVFKYVPFGPLDQSIPYLIRRALENSAVKTQTAIELSMIKKELQRRKVTA